MKRKASDEPLGTRLKRGLKVIWNVAIYVATGARDRPKEILKKGLILGLDGAGKTSLLYAPKLGGTPATVPTYGYNVEEFGTNKCTCSNPICFCPPDQTLSVGEIGGNKKMRVLWRHYTKDTETLFWVIDSSNSTRFEESEMELISFLSNDPQLAKSLNRLVIVCNKSDKPGALSVDQVKQAFSNLPPALSEHHPDVLVEWKSASSATETERDKLYPSLFACLSQ